MLPQVNEVWWTKSGRLAVIVATPQHQQQLSMLWWDEIDDELTVSPIINRLGEKSKLSFTDAMEIFGRYQREAVQ